MQSSPITGYSAFSDETTGETEGGYETAVATAVAGRLADECLPQTYISRLTTPSDSEQNKLN